MFRRFSQVLSDERGFVHKRLLGVVGKVGGFLPIPGAGAIATVARSLATTKAPPRNVQPRELVARPSASSEAGKEAGRGLKFGSVAANGNGDDCIFPFRRDPRTGDCKIFLGDRSGPDGRNGNGFQPSTNGFVGNAVVGRYGAAMQPGSMMIDRAVCQRGMQLANDGLCYDKKAISNRQRMWPRGRRPLLTGGEMRAIGIASRAGAKMDRTSKRLRELGMMKALPKPRGPKKAAVLPQHHH